MYRTLLFNVWLNAKGNAPIIYGVPKVSGATRWRATRGTLYGR